MRWLDAVKPTLLPSEPLAAAVNYYENHGQALFRFDGDPGWHVLGRGLQRFTEAQEG